MEVIKFPPRDQWASIQTRPVFDYTVLFDRVQKILDDVRQHGDKALINYTKQFDNANLESLEVTKEEIAEALGVAVALNAGAAMVYSARVLDALGE